MGPRARGRRARRGGRGRGQAKNQFSRGGGGTKSVKAAPATFIEIDSVESSGDEGVDISNVIDTSDLTILDEVTDNSNDEEAEENADEKLNLNTSENAEGIGSNGPLTDPTKNEESESGKIEQSSYAGDADTTEPNASGEDVSAEGTEAKQEAQEEEHADDDSVETSAAKTESIEAPEELGGEDKIEKDGLADENLVDEEDNCLEANEDQGIDGEQDEHEKEEHEVEEVEYVEEEEEYVEEEEEDGEEYVEIVEEVEEEEEEEEEEYVEEEEEEAVEGLEDHEVEEQEEEAVEGLEDHEVEEQERDESLGPKMKEEPERDAEEVQDNVEVDEEVVDLKGKLDSKKCKPLEEESKTTKGMGTKLKEMENQSKNNKAKDIEEKKYSAENLDNLDKHLVKDDRLNQNNEGKDIHIVETEKTDVEESASVKQESEVNAKKDGDTLELENFLLEKKEKEEEIEGEEEEEEEEEVVEYEEEEEEYVEYVEGEEEEVIEEEEEVIEEEEEELIDGEEEWVEEEEEEEVVDKIQEDSEVKEGNKEITDVVEANEKNEEKHEITSEANKDNATETNKDVGEKLQESSTDVQPANESLSKEEFTDKIKDVDRFTEEEATGKFDEEAAEEFDEEAEMEVLEEANGEGEENEEEYVEGEEEEEYVEGEEEEEYIEVEGDEEVEYEEVEEVEMEEEEEEEEEEVEYVEEIIEEVEDFEEEDSTKMPESEEKQDESKESSNNKIKDIKEHKDVTETAQKEAVTKEVPQKDTVSKEYNQNEALKKTQMNVKQKETEHKDQKLKEKQKSDGNEDCPILVLESSDDESEAQKTPAQANTLKRKKGSTIEINIKTDNLDKFKPALKKLPVKVEKKIEKNDTNSTEPVKKDLRKVSKPGDNSANKKPNLAVKKNLNALEKLMKSGDWKLMDETTESEKDTKLKQTLTFKKPFIRGVQEGRPAVYDLILAAKEPLLGLEYIVEVWKEDGKAPPRYFCSLCIYLLTHEELIKHLNHVSHKGNYLNLHARECWSRFPRSQPSKWSHEYVIALERVCTLMEENNMRRLTMLVTSKRTYDMYLGRIHHQADQLPHFYLPDTWRNIFTELKLDDPKKDDHPRTFSKEKKEERKYSGEDHWMSSSTRSAPNKSKRSPPRRSRTPEKRRRFSRSRSRSPAKRSRLDSPLSRKRSSSPSSYFNRNKRSKSPYDKFRSTKKRFRSRSRSPRRRSRSRSGSHSRRRRSPSFSRSRKRYSRSMSRSRSRSRSPNMRSRSPVRSHLHKKDIPFRPKEAQLVMDSSKREETGFVPGTFKKIVHVSSVKKLELNKAFNPLVSLSSSSIEENIYKTLQNFMKPSETPVHSSDNPRMHAISISPPVKEKRLQLYKPPPSASTNISTSSIYASSKNLSDEPNYTIKRLVTTKEVFPSAQKIEAYTCSQQEYSSQSKPTNFSSLKYVPLEPSINESSKKTAEGAEKWLNSLVADVPKAPRSRSNLKPIVLVDNPISISTSTKPVSSKSAYQSATNSLAAIKQIYSTKDRESFTNPSKPDIYPQEELLSSKSGIFSSSSAKHSLQVSSNPALKLSTQTGLSDSARKSRSIPYRMTEETKKEFIDFMCKIQSAPKIEEKSRAGIFATTKKSNEGAEKWLKTLAASGQTAATTSVDSKVSKGESMSKNKKSSNFWDSWMERHDENEEQTLPSASEEIPGRKGYSVNAFGNVKHLSLRNMETSALGYEMSKYQEGTHKRSAMHPDTYRKEKNAYISCDQSRRDESDPEDWLYRQEQQAWSEQPEYEEQANQPWRPPPQQQQQQQQHHHHHQLVPTPMPSEPQEDVTSVAEKLNSTLNRILKDYKPTGGLFSAPKLNEPPKERTYQPVQHSNIPNVPVVGNPVEKVNIAGNIAATLTKMGLTNVTQEQLVKIVHELGLLPSGFTAAEASNRIMSTLNANMPSNDGPYRYQHY